MKSLILCGMICSCAAPAPASAPPPRPPPVNVAAPAHEPVAKATPDAGSDVAAGLGDRHFELRWVRAWNLHYAGNTGAEHESSHGKVTVDLDARGRCVATDSGKREESHLSGNRYSTKSTEWQATWRGTCVLDHGKLKLDLERETTACSVTESERQGAQQYQPTTTQCSTGVDHLVLDCEGRSIEVEPASDDEAARPVPTRAWDCSPPEPAHNENGTSFPWVFGRGQCLERTGGAPRMGPIRYARCEHGGSEPAN